MAIICVLPEMFFGSSEMSQLGKVRTVGSKGGEDVRLKGCPFGDLLTLITMIK